MYSTELVLIEDDPAVFMDREGETMNVEFWHTIDSMNYWVEARVGLVPVQKGLRGWSRTTWIMIRDFSKSRYVFKYAPNQPIDFFYDGKYESEIFEIVMICEKIANPRWIEPFLTEDMQKAIMWSINDMEANFNEWVKKEAFGDWRNE